MDMQQQPEGALLNGRYRILDILGQGGMGTVYLAEQIHLEVPVALKEVYGVNSDDADDQAAVEQCRCEGRLLVRLHHPQLPAVIDAFSQDDCFYLAMEYIEGVTAQDLLCQEGSLAVDRVLQWGIQIAAVLSYLHSQQPPVIFRDLKPDNIIVQPDDSVKLIDFGIARRFNTSAGHDTRRLGSIGFSPPEQFGIQQTDQRSDIYSLGATMHYLLSGFDPSRRPFRFTSVERLNPAVPRPLSELIDRCLGLDPGQRPTDAEEVGRELMAIRDELARASNEIGINDPASALPPGFKTTSSILWRGRKELKTLLPRQGRPLRNRLRPRRPVTRRRAKHPWLVTGIPLLAVLLFPLLWSIPVRQRGVEMSTPHAKPTAPVNSVRPMPAHVIPRSPSTPQVPLSRLAAGLLSSAVAEQTETANHSSSPAAHIGRAPQHRKERTRPRIGLAFKSPLPETPRLLALHQRKPAHPKRPAHNRHRHSRKRPSQIIQIGRRLNYD